MSVGTIGRSPATVELRQKFVFLALIYALSLTANVALSAYCITIYINSAFQEYSTVFAQEGRISQVRGIIEQQRDLLTEGGADVARAYSDTQRRLLPVLEAVREDLLAEPTKSLSTDLDRAMERKDTAVKDWLERRRARQARWPWWLAAVASAKEWTESSRAGQTPAVAAPEAITSAFNEVFQALSSAGSLLNQQRQAKFNDVAQKQGEVITILVANTAVGALLMAVGVYFVRRWVLRPVGDLREATKQIAQGKFDYRIKPQSRDELGHLAREVNQMAGTIVEMQTQLVEQERLAAAGEMVTRLAHNIRNPLAGIRGLAETTITLHAADGEVVGSQQRIINTVDRFEKWLRDLQQSVSPLKLNAQNVRIGDLLEGVVTALSPMFDRRGVKVEVLIDPVVREVHLDSLHFEQAVVALVTNAAQASQAGQSVRIRVAPVPETPGRWRLTVEDEGLGIPPELRKKIFLPYFTTKPEGNGIGLAMASKVVRLHGGELTVESEVGRGSRFHATLPGLVLEE